MFVQVPAPRWQRSLLLDACLHPVPHGLHGAYARALSALPYFSWLALPASSEVQLKGLQSWPPWEADSGLDVLGGCKY